MDQVVNVEKPVARMYIITNKVDGTKRVVRTFNLQGIIESCYGGDNSNLVIVKG